jgi:hypothetical protein
MGFFSRSAAGKDGSSQQEKPPSDEACALENGPSKPQPSPQPPLLSLRALSFLYWIWLTPFIKLGNRRAIQVRRLSCDLGASFNRPAKNSRLVVLQRE